MNLEAQLQQTITDFSRRKAGGGITEIAIHVPDCWALDLSFNIPGQGTYRIRSLRQDDLESLLRFGTQLGAVSKDFFCPYPWQDEARLRDAFSFAIQQALMRRTASYLLEHADLPIGHFFLWAAGGNAHSREHGIELPELGVAIADAYQGRGFGGLAVNILQAMARSLQADGVELTTALTNESGWNTYLHAGFKYVGILRIPLQVDVTAATAGVVATEQFRDERQMVYIINAEKREAILRYLAMKRGE